MSIATNEPTPQLLVDLAADTGALRYGASGFLYGLGDDGVPTENTLAPIKPQVAAQKAPKGSQHPNGDAFSVADTFQRAGGRQIQIYIQDIYPNWPYDNLGLDDYLGKVAAVVRDVVAHPNRNLYTYVPFNEPDQIWYGVSPEQRRALCVDWKSVYQTIRSLDATGPIVGPNFARYREAFFAEFMAFCKEEGCLPDIVSWHELNSDFYTDWYAHYQHYREIEHSLEITPREIAINEYANFMDLSVPGQLVQWITRFENSKVDACLAYWHAAGDLCNLVVQNNQVTGGWWLYKWYADMTGHTVQVTPPNSNAAGLQGVAALDREKKQVRVLLGGASGSTTVVIQGFDAAPDFGSNVHVVVWSTEWTGVEGPSRGPTREMQADLAVVDGKIVVAIDGMESSSAYHMIITPGKRMAAYDEAKPWKASYEAEDAAITNATIRDGGSLAIPNKNYCSNGRYVSDIMHVDSRVAFAITVPSGGDYLLDIFYGNSQGAVAEQRLQVDGEPWVQVAYPPNVGPQFIDRQSLTLFLTAGAHSITLAPSAAAIGGTSLPVNLDKLDITQATAASRIKRYEAEYATLAGGAVIRSDSAGYAGTGFVAGYNGSAAASTHFVVSVHANAFYAIALRYAAGPLDGAPENRAVRMIVNDALAHDLACPGTATWDTWATATATVFLQAGINRIALRAFPGDSRSAISIDYIEVAPGSGPIATYEAEAPDNTLGGTACVAHDAYASGQQYVGSIGNGADNYLQFNNVHVANAGPHKMVVHYANAEKIGAHDYNVNVVDRCAEISVNGGRATTTYFRNTFGWNAYRTTVVDVQLAAGSNTIRFFHSAAHAPNIDTIEIAAAIIA